MTWLTVAFIAFLGLWIYERGRNQCLRYQNRQLLDRLGQIEGDSPSQESERDEGEGLDAKELEDLRERVQVLERIATDENSSEARKAQRIAQEIESLRTDIARRSSKKTEELSE